MSQCNTTENLLAYAEQRIEELGLDEGCNGIVASIEDGSVRLSDGIGLDVLCQTEGQVEAELAEMRGWWDEAEAELEQGFDRN
jgi:hypothetical protein